QQVFAPCPETPGRTTGAISVTPFVLPLGNDQVMFLSFRNELVLFLPLGENLVLILPLGENLVLFLHVGENHGRWLLGPARALTEDSQQQHGCGSDSAFHRGLPCLKGRFPSLRWGR